MKTTKIILALALTFSFVNAFNQMYVKNTTGDDDGNTVFTKDIEIGDEWGLSSSSSGLNLYKPSSSTNPDNYKLFLNKENGHLGLGTNNVPYKLTVAGDIFLGNGSYLFLNWLNDSHWRFGKDTEHNINLFAYGLNNRKFRIINSPASTEVFTLIISSGYVGIGKSDPQYKLDVNGYVHAFNSCLSSDIKYKKNIKEISKGLDVISKLRSVEYNFSDSAINLMINKTKNDSIIDLEKEEKEKVLEEKIQYGFIAQEVKEILPETVYEDSKGNLSISYTSIIPILVKSVQEQQNTIDDLKNQLATLNSMVCNCDNKKTGNNTTVSEPTQTSSYIEQNIPNPFNENTEIKYFIEESVKEATIYIYNMQGYQIDSYEIMDRGESSLMIYGQTMMPGMYLYTLIVDGKEIDTKKMILTE